MPWREVLVVPSFYLSILPFFGYRPTPADTLNHASSVQSYPLLRYAYPLSLLSPSRLVAVEVYGLSLVPVPPSVRRLALGEGVLVVMPLASMPNNPAASCH